MTERYQVSPASLEALFAALAQKGIRVLAPKAAKGRVEIGEVKTAAEIAPSYVQSVSSAKPTVFPKVERILGFKRDGHDVAIDDPAPAARPTVVFGLRPCEARAFGALDALFNWDYRDAFFNARMEQVTVVAIACTKADDACFCTSVGGGPEDPRGCDVLLHPLQGGGYIADVLTEKGMALFKHSSECQTPVKPDAAPVPIASVEKAFDGAALGGVLAKRFEDPIWTEQSLRCLGCGACAFVCPTCACFDIQDEQAGGAGSRLRCWDSCGLHQFTLHASGHNPREKQSQRWRQRVYHKFSYYPERLGMLGCVGCGKCSRACPVDMNLKEHLAEVARIP